MSRSRAGSRGPCATVVETHAERACGAFEPGASRRGARNLAAQRASRGAEVGPEAEVGKRGRDVGAIQLEIRAAGREIVRASQSACARSACFSGEGR